MPLHGEPYLDTTWDELPAAGVTSTAAFETEQPFLTSVGPQLVRCITWQSWLADVFPRDPATGRLLVLADLMHADDGSDDEDDENDEDESEDEENKNDSDDDDQRMPPTSIFRGMEAAAAAGGRSSLARPRRSDW
jgi:hypothetical protein